MKQEDHEQTSAFSDFLGALGLSGNRKLPPEGETPEQRNPESAAEEPAPPPPEAEI